MADIQNRIQNLLDDAVQGEQELGAQVAAYINGELVVDAWSGAVNSKGGAAVDGATLFPVFSTTKGIAATILHLLVERGQVGYDTRVAEAWPEFAAHGKGQITLRQCMNHTAGLPQMPPITDWAQLHDWDTMCAAMADLTPLWPPGSRMEYHAITYGWLLGEVARRVDGRPFAQLVQDEICRPLGIETLFAGLPDELQSRVAILEARDLERPIIDDTVPQPVPAWLWPLHEMMNRPEARRACQPASNGVMNARAIARHYAALLPGGVDGVELLPPERVRIATTWEPPPGEPPMKAALGYMIIGDDAFGHGGYGGSLGLAHPEHRLAFGFTRNLFSPVNVLDKVMSELHAYVENSTGGA